MKFLISGARLLMAMINLKCIEPLSREYENLGEIINLLNVPHSALVARLNIPALVV